MGRRPAFDPPRMAVMPDSAIKMIEIGWNLLRPEEFLGLARQVRGGMVSLFAFAILQPLPISEPRGGSRRPQAASTFSNPEGEPR